MEFSINLKFIKLTKYELGDRFEVAVFGAKIDLSCKNFQPQPLTNFAFYRIL